MENTQEMRQRVAEAILVMSPDDPCLALFWEAFQYRRSLGQGETYESERDIDDVKALKRALRRAFTRELDVSSDKELSSQVKNTLQFPEGLPKMLVEALKIVEDSYFKSFIESLDTDDFGENREQPLTIAELLTKTFLAYARESRNGVGADPW